MGAAVLCKDKMLLLMHVSGRRYWVHPKLKSWVARHPPMAQGDQYRAVLMIVNRATGTTTLRSNGVQVRRCACP